MTSIFKFTNYKHYLVAVEEDGTYKFFRSLLAKAASCQNAYVSQVLNGSQHFSLEQADGIATTMALSADEREYFFLMLQAARAAKESLRRFFQDRASKIARQQIAIRHQAADGEILTEAQKQEYYSEWYYSAAHVLTTIDEFQSVESISNRLRIPLDTAKQVVRFLLGTGLLEDKKQRLKPGKKRLFLGEGSPFVNQQHKNWRIHVGNSLGHSSEDDLHYSSVVTLSRADAEKIRSDLILAIQRAKDIIRDSSEEEALGFHLDFYRL